MMSGCAETIKKIREELGASQYKLAKLLNITNTAVYQYEHNLRNPSRKLVLKILELAKQNNIKVSIEDLLT